MRWSPGDTVAWRVRVRIAPERPDGEIGVVFPATVVSDEPDEHQLSLFWDDATDALRFWYFDFVSPLLRTRTGFESVDHGIDLVVEPDLSSWTWKDADELDWYVEHGRYTRTEADAIRAEGERAVERLVRERERYDRWRDWRPDPSWRVPALPDGWDAE